MSINVVPAPAFPVTIAISVTLSRCGSSFALEHPGPDYLPGAGASRGCPAFDWTSKYRGEPITLLRVGEICWMNAIRWQTSDRVQRAIASGTEYRQGLVFRSARSESSWPTCWNRGGNRWSGTRSGTGKTRPPRTSGASARVRPEIYGGLPRGNGRPPHSIAPKERATRERTASPKNCFDLRRVGARQRLVGYAAA